MRHTLSTQIDIAAPPEEVWNILTKFDEYQNWNPFMVFAKGKPQVGETLVNRMKPPDGKAMTFKPKVTVAKQYEVFEWLGSAGIPGIFDGRHRFELKKTKEGTRLLHSEAFSGLLIRPMKKSLDSKTLEGFKMMNTALKSRAENNK